MNDRRYDSRKDDQYADQDDERYGGGVLEERSRRAFDDSVEALDAATLSQLNRARQAALAGVRGDRPASGWRPVATAAAVAVLAVALWLGQLPEKPVAEHETVAAVAPEEAEDLEIVLQDDNLEMLAELEFYDWVDSEEAFRNAPVGSGHIG